MAPTRNNSASASIPAKKDDGSNHLVECIGPEMDGNGCIIWTNVWVPTLIPKNFARPFLGGFCDVEELQQKTSTVDDRSPIIEADSTEQYGRRENVRIFGVEEEPDEDVFAKVVSVAEKAGVTIITTTANDVSTCHRLPVGGKGPKPLFAKFVRWDSKHQIDEAQKEYERNQYLCKWWLDAFTCKINPWPEEWRWCSWCCNCKWEIYCIHLR